MKFPYSSDKDDDAKTEFLAHEPCYQFQMFLYEQMYGNQSGIKQWPWQISIYNTWESELLKLDCIFMETVSFSLPWLLFAELASLLLFNEPPEFAHSPPTHPPSDKNVARLLLLV